MFYKYAILGIILYFFPISLNADINYKKHQAKINYTVRLIKDNMNCIPGNITYHLIKLGLKDRPGLLVLTFTPLVLSEAIRSIYSLVSAPFTIKVFLKDIKKISLSAS